MLIRPHSHTDDDEFMTGWEKQVREYPKRQSQYLFRGVYPITEKQGTIGKYRCLEKEKITCPSEEYMITAICRFLFCQTSLYPEHISVLKKGLSFVPTQDLNLHEWVKDINLFARKLALKKEYKDKPSDPTQCTNSKDIEMLRILESLQEEEEV